MQEKVIRIEQRLQEHGRILLFPIDEGLALLAPAGVGLAMQAAVAGIILGLVSYVLWKRIKGDGGLERILALTYWYLPAELSPMKSWPDSAVTMWRG
ncbi:type IV conjugative transfer system protein TraL (plasmid) [Cereibacter azotoformans]|uniref:type IV conjugative transfer system protein TraL n=1 Tax=Cereibacter azotoformans TaxID=43057 RepID=UPI001EEBB73B|nr:type IV conjugative transfer system protein TraL [Cereibacter azotoformans]ULB12498.1 type IV conjugative transfer system protein TraL [Cereibacter azotoformans]